MRSNEIWIFSKHKFAQTNFTCVTNKFQSGIYAAKEFKQFLLGVFLSLLVDVASKANNDIQKHMQHQCFINGNGQLTAADANTIFWIYRSIKAMFLQIWIEIAIDAAQEAGRTMTLSVEF